MKVNPLDLRVADLCAADYDGKAVPTWETPGKCRAFKHLEPGGLWVIFEGTRPGHVADWLRDAGAGIVARSDPAFGDLAWSFFEDVVSVIFRMYREIGAEAVVNFGGHSKGASEALIAAAVWKFSGRRLGRVTALEPARVGALGGQLAGVPGLLTWVKRHPFIADPVPELPSWLAHPMPVTALEAPQFTLNPIDCHELATVRAAMEAA